MNDQERRLRRLEERQQQRDETAGAMAIGLLICLTLFVAADWLTQGAVRQWLMSVVGA